MTSTAASIPTRPDLQGIPETMLWTLHNRASDALRPDGSHALRSRLFDDALRPWLAAHPGGLVVELACGLETQCRRCDDGQVRWLCVDVPEAIAIRERFLPASERCRHLGRSALDLSWLDEVDSARGVFITAQGLLMYFSEEQVRGLLTAIGERLPGAVLMFDTIPPFFSRKTLKGYWKTASYRAPPMPWGIRRGDIAAVLRRWLPQAGDIQLAPYGMTRGGLGRWLTLFSLTPGLRDLLPAVVRVEIGAG